MMRASGRLSWMAAVGWVVFACDPLSHPLSRSLPDSSGLSMHLADAVAGGAMTSPELLRLRALAENLNEGTEEVLDLVHDLMQEPATTVDGTTKTWGPGQESPLHSAFWTLMATQNSNGSCDWVLSGVNRRAQDFYWVVANGNVADCTATRPEDGDFCFYPENWNYVNEDSLARDETFFVDYAAGGRLIDLFFDSANGDGKRWAISFDRAPDNSLTMRQKGTGPTSMEENFAQLLPTGAGRSDSVAAESLPGGGIGQLTSSECWDDFFDLVYFGDSLGNRAGDEQACAFGQASLPSQPQSMPPVASLCGFPLVGDPL